MKIINRESLMRLSAGVLYCDYSPPSYFGRLKIKGETLNANNPMSSGDWMLQTLSVLSGSSRRDQEIIADAINNKSSFEFSLDMQERDGEFDWDGLFAVYEQADLDALRIKLHAVVGAVIEEAQLNC